VCHSSSELDLSPAFSSPAGKFSIKYYATNLIEPSHVRSCWFSGSFDYFFFRAKMAMLTESAKVFL